MLKMLQKYFYFIIEDWQNSVNKGQGSKGDKTELWRLNRFWVSKAFKIENPFEQEADSDVIFCEILTFLFFTTRPICDSFLLLQNDKSLESLCLQLPLNLAYQISNTADNTFFVLQKVQRCFGFKTGWKSHFLWSFRFC